MKVKLPEDVRGRTATFLVSNGRPTVSVRQNWATLEVKSVLDHEVIVIR